MLLCCTCMYVCKYVCTDVSAHINIHTICIHMYICIYCMFLMSSKLAEVYFSRGRAEWTCLLLSETTNASTVVSHSSILSLCLSLALFSLELDNSWWLPDASKLWYACVWTFGYQQIYKYIHIYVNTVLPTLQYEKKLFLTAQKKPKH